MRASDWIGDHNGADKTVGSAAPNDCEEIPLTQRRDHTVDHVLCELFGFGGAAPPEVPLNWAKSLQAQSSDALFTSGSTRSPTTTWPGCPTVRPTPATAKQSLVDDPLCRARRIMLLGEEELDDRRGIRALL